MKKLALLLFASLIALTIFTPAKAAGGIFSSGGGSHVEGETFTVSVRASGATFNAFQGTISISGPVTVVSFGAGSATWVRQPSNGGQFVGMVTSSTSSLAIASIRLKGTRAGSGSVSVSGVSLANNGSAVGSGAGGTSFTITRAPVVPGAVTVTSTSHPDQNTFYDATTIALNWDKASGVTGFSYLLDQVAGTTLGNKVDSANTTVSYENQKIGTYYFHIKAQNGDGWGPVTHFKINIKEPDAKVKDGLTKPTNIKILKDKKFSNNIKDGTVSGIIITGKIPTKAAMEKALAATTAIDASAIESSTKELYTANVLLSPEQLVPEGKKLSVTPDKTGSFRLLIDWPIKAGSYRLSVQGQRDKLLTPASDIKYFEIQQKNGGKIVGLSNKDSKEIIVQKTFWQKYKENIIVAGLTLSFVIIVMLLRYLIGLLLRKKPKDKKKTTGFKWD